MGPQSRSSERSDICLHIYDLRTVVECQQFDAFTLTGVFLFNANLGEVQQPVRSWRGWDLAAGRLPWSLCHPRCWKSCKSRKWRRNNTGHTGFGQMLCMRDIPAEQNMNYEHTKSRDKRIEQNRKTEMFCFSGTVQPDF